jgi:hypothetical protein
MDELERHSFDSQEVPKKFPQWLQGLPFSACFCALLQMSFGRVKCAEMPGFHEKNGK